MIEISPSIMAANYTILGQEITDITNALADSIHIDIMDGHFVPNLTMGPDLVKSLRKYSHLDFDVHLMVSFPEKWIDKFIDAGADLVIIHAESSNNPLELLEYIKSQGVKCAISLMPGANLDIIDSILPIIDQIMVMTVMPGFCGQKFIENQLDIIKTIRDKISSRDIKLIVDGGINEITAKKSIEYGANKLVAGSYIFESGSSNYRSRIETLRCLTKP